MHMATSLYQLASGMHMATSLYQLATPAASTVHIWGQSSPPTPTHQHTPQLHLATHGKRMATIIIKNL